MTGDGTQKRTIALVGNPNVGKSTLFNALTGLRRHTGNWSGKTVDIAAGQLRGSKGAWELVDLPGTYSMTGHSEEERLAAAYIESGTADCVVVVCDGSALERNLILALQILQRAERVVVCVNLMDEARQKGVQIDSKKLSNLLGVPVVLTAAARNDGLKELIAEIHYAIASPPPVRKAWENPVQQAQSIAAQCVSQGRCEPWRLALDKILISRRRGLPIMLMLLFFIVWLTVWGANAPAMWLQNLFDRGYVHLSGLMCALPWWLQELLLDGIYATAARVIAVMLPPMAIFFPLFTILEDVGYLPRMAFLLDSKMRRCGGCGKQALTLCMGLGCNAVGVMGCRIIDSPRERRLAILTNSMVPCNGRFPSLILLAGICCIGPLSALAVAGCVVMGALGAMAVSGVLSKTALRHTSSVFLMELPPLRKPQLGQILVRSLLDRTIYVAGRALAVAAPAGAVYWLLQQLGVLPMMADFLDPFGRLLGMNGVILLAFALALPANELLIPLILMVDGRGLEMSAVTAVCTMVFTVFHWPCSTTILTVYKETGSIKTTAAAVALPTAVGMGLCMILNWLLKYFGC